MDYFEYGLIIGATIFFLFLGLKYFDYWKQVKKGFLESGIKWPLDSQAELNETARTDLPGGYQMMGGNMAQAAKIVFSMRTDNPAILKPLRGMRRILLAVVLIPILLAIVLVITFGFFAI
ncbi:MAG: hypothetical protein JWN18_238 [Parcubacteria group bacterium]|nr:hypothetical protein [Parcubacteria group bacterium]